MKTIIKKHIGWVSCVLIMLTYVAFIMYKSEPKYIDNVGGLRQYSPKKYDIISCGDGNPLQLVIQIDTLSFKNHYILCKQIDRWGDFSRHQIHIVAPDYALVGEGTFYHKVNEYIGFNIIIISTIFIFIGGVILAVYLINKAFQR